MDIIDVSTVDQYLDMFANIKQNEERASLRKGGRPQHPPPSLLQAYFMLNRSPQGPGSSNNTIYTTHIPAHYTPCIRPIYELKPLLISGMTLETHHRGTQVIVRVLTPTDRLNPVMAIVEDEKGTATILQLFNQPDKSKVNRDNMLRTGQICIIKEPFLKGTTAALCSLRVDHVSDIVWLDDTDNRAPLEWRQRIMNLDDNSSDVRLQGNLAFKVKDWGEAESLYTKAIRIAETTEEKQLAYLNRSLVDFHLGRPEKALDDACNGGSNADSPSEKSLFRAARALYALGKYSPCLEKLLALVHSNPRNAEAWTEIKRVKQRLREEESGEYRFGSMYEQAKATPPLIDCATYIGPVAIRDSPGKGNGIFTTKSVKAGELLFCEKAFAYSYASDDNPIGLQNRTIFMNLNSDRIYVGGQADVISQVVQKIYHNPAGSKIFTDLHHGDYEPVTVSEVDGTPVVDTFFIAKIIELNCFGAPRTSFNYTATFIDGKIQHDGIDAYTTCGVWPFASRINHSCIANCRRSFIGDMLIVRASEDIPADTELCFQYSQREPDDTYADIQRRFSNWGFACECALCAYTKRTTHATIKERKTLHQNLKQVLKPQASEAQLAKAATILEKLDATYNHPAGQAAYPPLPRLDLWDPYYALGMSRINMGKLADGLEMLLKSLEALGFVLVACPPRCGEVDKKKKKKKKKEKAVLEIKQWGYVNNYTMKIFLHILRVYNKLAPELREVVKEYGRIAYCIWVGEMETVGKRYPDFV